MTLEPKDFAKLAPGLLVALVLAGLGGGLVWWSLGAVGKATLEDNLSKSQFAEADRKLREVNLEEAEIRANSTFYRELQARGIIGPERRLEWVEIISEARKARRLFDIEYEFLPQQTLPGGGAPYRFGSSTMRFRLPLLHEGDLLTFLGDLRVRAPAYIDVQQCAMDRLPGQSASNLSPHLTGSCTLQWITIQTEQASGSQR